MPWRHILGGMALVAASQATWAGEPATRVALVQPSGTEVPANLLRLSVVFEAPVEGAVLPRIALTYADGRPLWEPFLQQELWSPDGKILTLLLHPGRVKTGLIAREQWGPILREGEDIVLTLDRRPIKQWHVDPADENGPVASAWKLSPVDAGSRQPLIVTFDAPIDGRDADYLAIVDANDHRVTGRSKLSHGESTWSFKPNQAWDGRGYRLIVRSTLEDPSGNRLGGRFESPMGSVQPTATDTVISFKAGPAGGKIGTNGSSNL